MLVVVLMASEMGKEYVIMLVIKWNLDKFQSHKLSNKKTWGKDFLLKQNLRWLNTVINHNLKKIRHCVAKLFFLLLFFSRSAVLDRTWLFCKHKVTKNLSIKDSVHHLLTSRYRTNWQTTNQLLILFIIYLDSEPMS